MWLRSALVVPLFSAAAFAASHKPVCPGPAAPETGRCHARVVTDKHGQPLTTTGPSGFGPAQFRTAYGLPSSASRIQTIAIVDAFNDPNVEADLGVYGKHYGLPPCTKANGCFKKVNQSGGTSFPKTNPGWALEISLDVEIAHAICPNCKILLVEATSNSFANLLAAEGYAVKHANVVANSWGATNSPARPHQPTTDISIIQEFQLPFLQVMADMVLSFPHRRDM